MSALRQPFRTVVGLTNLLMRLGIGPTAGNVLKQSAAQRQLISPPIWMSRRGDQTIGTRMVTVAGRGGPVPLRVYERPNLAPGQPAIVYLHGGGFIVGGLDACDYIARGLAARTGLPVYSVEYRLAPESPYPGPLQDCEDALRWLVEGGAEDIDVTRIAVAGDSAGGNLAAALALLIRDTGGPAIAHQSLIYPFTDATISSSDWETYAGAGVDRDGGRQMVAWYAPNHPADEPYVSVLHAPSLEGLPPALVVTAECDVLHSDGDRYARRLLEAGVPLVTRNFRGVPHGFLSMSRLCRDSDLALDLIAKEISSALSASKQPSNGG